MSAAKDLNKITESRKKEGRRVTGGLLSMVCSVSEIGLGVLVV